MKTQIFEKTNVEYVFLDIQVTHTKPKNLQLHLGCHKWTSIVK